VRRAKGDMSGRNAGEVEMREKVVGRKHVR